jgi:hypothetical protein
MFPQVVDPNVQSTSINPEAEARTNATPIADEVEVTETIDQANERRGINYLLAFGAFIAVLVVLSILA